MRLGVMNLMMTIVLLLIQHISRHFTPFPLLAISSPLRMTLSRFPFLRPTALPYLTYYNITPHIMYSRPSFIRLSYIFVMYGIISNMNKELSPLQTKVLNLLRAYDAPNTTYRELGDKLGGKHPYSIQQAIDGLVRKGYLIRNEKTKEVTIPKAPSDGKVPFLNIPVLGGVSCGLATDMAYDTPAGTITVTPSVATIKRPERTFALIARGDSMTKANINGKHVESGDYVVIEKASYANVRSGDYVVSRYNDMYNLKKIKLDLVNERFILLSESDLDIPPIIVAAEDAEYFDIEGVAVDIIRGL